MLTRRFLPILLAVLLAAALPGGASGAAAPATARNTPHNTGDGYLHFTFIRANSLGFHWRSWEFIPGEGVSSPARQTVHVFQQLSPGECPATADAERRHPHAFLGALPVETYDLRDGSDFPLITVPGETSKTLCWYMLGGPHPTWLITSTVIRP